MKSLFTQRPRFYFVLFVMASLSGFGAQRASAISADFPNQCWYDTGTEPRCQYCFDPCMGSGYVCCRIVTPTETRAS